MRPKKEYLLLLVFFGLWTISVLGYRLKTEKQTTELDLLYTAFGKIENQLNAFQYVFITGNDSIIQANYPFFRYALYPRILTRDSLMPNSATLFVVNKTENLYPDFKPELLFWQQQFPNYSLSFYQ